MKSHPTWVCGLKLNIIDLKYGKGVSHPTWVCGLKHDVLNNGCEKIGVTPYVGVWIETVFSSYLFFWYCVTPYVGVWIETFCTLHFHGLVTSHPTWVCGLKLTIIHI